MKDYEILVKKKNQIITEKENYEREKLEKEVNIFFFDSFKETFLIGRGKNLCTSRCGIKEAMR